MEKQAGLSTQEEIKKISELYKGTPSKIERDISPKSGLDREYFNASGLREIEAELKQPDGFQRCINTLKAINLRLKSYKEALGKHGIMTTKNADNIERLNERIKEFNEKVNRSGYQSIEQSDMLALLASVSEIIK